MLMNFDLTEKHISNGKFGISRDCPVALCIKETTGATDVIIGLNQNNQPSCFINKYEVVLPKGVQNFVGDYDGRRPVRPFSFSLKMPAMVLEALDK
jgi:hypothetical protein